MTRKLVDVPLETALVEHYLFDLGYPVEKVSEIADVDRNVVEKIFKDGLRYIIPARRIQ